MRNVVYTKNLSCFLHQNNKKKHAPPNDITTLLFI